ncbi:hypothetical protein FACS1894172_14670 [Spirochaetia bacterium]|nr:hypothetical protein FACS1894164_16920 [Spirochaetia bacterium]GHU34429.1 hypothetical protein FACS1894172_14670 [Spirochaetia bacterium]
MKRIAFVSLLLIFVLSFVTAQEAAQETVPEAAPFVLPANETSLSAGFVFGNTFVYDPDNDDSYFGSPGMAFEGYSFWNHKNFGIFYHGSFAFPVVGEGKDNHDFQWEGIFGPAFRIRFTDRLTLQTGIGIGGSGLFARYEENGVDYFRAIFNFGVGADAGLKFDITDKFFIKGGANVMWSFLGGSVAHETSRNGDWNPKGYSTLAVNPYITFGLNIYSPRREIPRRPDRPHLGKKSFSALPQKGNISYPLLPQTGKPPREQAAQ